MRHKQNPLIERIAESANANPITVRRLVNQILEMLQNDA